MAENESISVFELTAKLRCLKCTLQLQQPRILPCHHTFCKSCIDDVVEENGEFDTNGNLTLRCPKEECNKPFIIKHNETSSDVPTIDIVDDILRLVSGCR